MWSNHKTGLTTVPLETSELDSTLGWWAVGWGGVVSQCWWVVGWGGVGWSLSFLKGFLLYKKSSFLKSPPSWGSLFVLGNESVSRRHIFFTSLIGIQVLNVLGCAFLLTKASFFSWSLWMTFSNTSCTWSFLEWFIDWFIVKVFQFVGNGVCVLYSIDGKHHFSPVWHVPLFEHPFTNHKEHKHTRTQTHTHTHTHTHTQINGPLKEYFTVGAHVCRREQPSDGINTYCMDSTSHLFVRCHTVSSTIFVVWSW